MDVGILLEVQSEINKVLAQNKILEAENKRLQADVERLDPAQPSELFDLPKTLFELYRIMDTENESPRLALSTLRLSVAEREQRVIVAEATDGRMGIAVEYPLAYGHVPKPELLPVYVPRAACEVIARSRFRHVVLRATADFVTFHSKLDVPPFYVLKREPMRWPDLSVVLVDSPAPVRQEVRLAADLFRKLASTAAALSPEMTVRFAQQGDALLVYGEHEGLKFRAALMVMGE